MDDDEQPSTQLWELVLAMIARGLCASCHFAPAANGGSDAEPWRCPRCGFLSSDDPEAWGPVSRYGDPVGADEPRYAVEGEDYDEDDGSEAWEPDFPIFGRRPTR